MSVSVEYLHVHQGGSRYSNHNRDLPNTLISLHTLNSLPDISQHNLQNSGFPVTPAGPQLVQKNTNESKMFPLPQARKPPSCQTNVRIQVGSERAKGVSKLLRVLFYFQSYVHMHVRVWTCAWEWSDSEARKGCHIPWSWRYRQLWTALCMHWELNLDLFPREICALNWWAIFSPSKMTRNWGGQGLRYRSRRIHQGSNFRAFRVQALTSLSHWTWWKAEKKAKRWEKAPE